MKFLYYARIALFVLFLKPFIWIFLSPNVKGLEKLPMKGPAILMANHNSHLDTISLMSLYPLRLLSKVRPVAAADYFMCNRFLSWICKNILQIIPIRRANKRALKSSFMEDPLEKVSEALNHGSIVIFYPEGTRGLPEKMTSFKAGIARLSERHPNVPIVPVFFYGHGKALPKGSALLVPFNVRVVIGEAVQRNYIRQDFILSLQKTMQLLSMEVQHG